jgi:hypothetical protein
MLLHRPRESVEDFFVHASYGPVTGKGTLVVDCTPNGRVTVPSLGINTATGKKITVTVNPWSAETLTLYQGLLETPGEPKLLESVSEASRSRMVSWVSTVAVSSSRESIDTSSTQNPAAPSTEKQCSRTCNS